VISRQWRGLAKQESAEDYVQHLRSETFPALNALQGFISATICRRIASEGVEFLIVTQWESIEAIHDFAGSNAEVAVVPEKVRDMMIEYDHTVRHYDIVES
jgi:heme-degrading monooxygenase HmoA